MDSFHQHVGGYKLQLPYRRMQRRRIIPDPSVKQIDVQRRRKQRLVLVLAMHVDKKRRNRAHEG